MSEPTQDAQIKSTASSGLAPLTAAEIQAHPEYPHVNWDLKPDKREKIDVARGRGGPFKIAYELHGHGPNHVGTVETIDSSSTLTSFQDHLDNGPRSFHEDLATADERLRSHASR